jgi:hypothetical protein
MEANKLLIVVDLYYRTIVHLLDIIHRPDFFIKNVSETEFCLGPQVKAISVGYNQQS